ncbi:GlxA family transcriptional regulator [Desulfoluna spongiiphila]|uniref:GlxA family transcriptional regulator n=1 Tax=Desulfoluna spongiiphila TaxID=419481 RepID=UPI00125248BE|nr:helix-turn-helix domain-containing protein [Desulfoluna spongiiphila]VVS90668.1 transcription regulator hth arac- type [Desulfoluna spongiiphila]
MAHITLLAYPGCATSCITGTIDALSIANRWQALIGGEDEKNHPLFHWDIVSLDGKTVQGDNRITIEPHRSMGDVTTTDLILIPGFIAPMAFLQSLPEQLIAWIRAWYGRGAMIAATCTGSFLLAETGLLDGKEATTNWVFARHFKKRYPRVHLKPERLLTEDDRLLCTGATSAYMDLCLYLIKTFGSEELSATCAKGLLLESNRSSQSPFFIFEYYKAHSDPTVLKAQGLMEAHYPGPLSIEAMASELAISPRHFVRRFKSATGDTPLAYLQRVRIEAAKQTLEKTSEPIDAITRQVGYEDTNSFRKLFKKSTGLSPKEYRDRFTRLPNRSRSECAMT